MLLIVFFKVHYCVNYYGLGMSQDYVEEHDGIILNKFICDTVQILLWYFFNFFVCMHIQRNLSFGLLVYKQ